MKKLVVLDKKTGETIEVSSNFLVVLLMAFSYLLTLVIIIKKPAGDYLNDFESTTTAITSALGPALFWYKIFDKKRSFLVGFPISYLITATAFWYGSILSIYMLLDLLEERLHKS